MAQLTEEHIVTIHVLKSRGQTNCQIARMLGVTEGTVRYHARRAAEGATDGRQRPMRLERLGLAESIAVWWSDETARLPEGRTPNVEGYRYGRGSMCITSNKAISTWPEMLAGDEVITGAILDRLLHASTVLSIKGRSYRLRDLEEALRPKG